MIRARGSTPGSIVFTAPQFFLSSPFCQTLVCLQGPQSLSQFYWCPVFIFLQIIKKITVWAWVSPFPCLGLNFLTCKMRGLALMISTVYSSSKIPWWTASPLTRGALSLQLFSHSLRQILSKNVESLGLWQNWLRIQDLPLKCWVTLARKVN